MVWNQRKGTLYSCQDKLGKERGRKWWKTNNLGTSERSWMYLCLWNSLEGDEQVNKWDFGAVWCLWASVVSWGGPCWLWKGWCCSSLLERQRAGPAPVSSGSASPAHGASLHAAHLQTGTQKDETMARKISRSLCRANRIWAAQLPLIKKWLLAWLEHRRGALWDHRHSWAGAALPIVPPWARGGIWGSVPVICGLQ